MGRRARRRGFVVVDGDDTLWDVESLYEAARSQIRSLVTDQGVDPEAWERLQRKDDLARFEVERFSPDRFPGSCVSSYLELASRFAVGNVHETAASVDELARQVFAWKAPLAPDAETTLRELRTFYSLFLLTQGDTTVQEKRIADSGLSALFDGLFITGHKDEHAFRDVIDRAGVGRSGWSVGNSLASDIEPALRCGLKAVLVTSKSWEFEQRSSSVRSGDFENAATLSDVLPVLLCMTSQIA